MMGMKIYVSCMCLIALTSLLEVSSAAVWKNQNGNMVQAFIEEVINQKNVGALNKFLLNDYSEKMALFPKRDQSSECCGIKGINDMKKKLQRAFTEIPDLHIEIENLVQDGNSVMYTAVKSGTHVHSHISKEGGTGKRFELKCSVHTRLCETTGKLAFSEIFCDYGGLMQHFVPGVVTIDVNGNAVVDNLNSGIETYLARRISALSEAYQSDNLPVEDIKRMHSADYKAYSPAFPEGINLQNEMKYLQGLNQCLTNKSKGVKAKVELLKFYFDEELSGVTAIWKLSGIHASKCPAPYDFQPTQNNVELYGASYHKFNMDGLITSKRVLLDNLYLKKMLGGKQEMM